MTYTYIEKLWSFSRILTENFPGKSLYKNRWCNLYSHIKYFLDDESQNTSESLRLKDNSKLLNNNRFHKNIEYVCLNYINRTLRVTKYEQWTRDQMTSNPLHVFAVLHVLFIVFAKFSLDADHFRVNDHWLDLNQFSFVIKPIIC